MKIPPITQHLLPKYLRMKKKNTKVEKDLGRFGKPTPVQALRLNTKILSVHAHVVDWGSSLTNK